MLRRPRSVLLVAAAIVSFAPPAFAAPPEESFIVVLTPGTPDVPAAAAALARQATGSVSALYEHALKGFSMTAPPAAARGLVKNPDVAYVEADRPWTVEAQSIPTGIDRTFASSSSTLRIDMTDNHRVDVDVAVIDTGIDWDHPDLNVVDGINCAQGTRSTASCSGNGDDDHYHGTHVAGTIGAVDNGTGVVGMAPGARLHAVKVLNARGSGYTSWVLAGIEWVTERADTIEVANMSVGSRGFSRAHYDAIQAAVEQGVAFAVAAGNSDADASTHSPAGFDNVLTVSALADFDGLPGAKGEPTCLKDQDDTLADFSNWGGAVDIAAPGACILSTYPMERGEYGTISGTSMASPHAAGVLAVLASAGTHTDVYDLYAAVTSAGNFDWTDDSGDGVKEPLLDVRAFDLAR